MSFRTCRLPIKPYHNGVVLGGYDLVEYFNIAGFKTTDPVFVPGTKGNPVYKVRIRWKSTDYDFWFVSRGNLRKFIESPEKYLPQYGGFCSWSIANKYQRDSQTKYQINDKSRWNKFLMNSPGEPSHGATIYLGKLYLNYWDSEGPDMKKSFFYQKSSIHNKKYRISVPHIKLPTEIDTIRYIGTADKIWRDFYGDLKSGPFSV